MKKASKVLLAILLVAASLLVLCSCRQNVGGYTKDRKVTDEDLEIFNQAMEGHTGVGYVPEKVATQVVAGTNYRFYCKATPVVPNAESYYVHIIVFVPLGDDPAPELTEILELD